MTLPKCRDLLIPIAALEDNSVPVEREWMAESLEKAGEYAFPEPVKVKITTDKVEQGYLVQVHAIGRAALICDRCGTGFFCPVEGSVRSFYTFSTGMNKEVDAEIHVLPSSTRRIDLSQDALDALLLGLPPKNLCREECKGLCDQCGADLNDETCQCSKDDIDPRWEALKGLSSQADDENHGNV